MSTLLYGCTTWRLTKRTEKKLDGNYTRMLRAILKKSWRQHPTKQQQYGHLQLIAKTIHIRRTRHAGYCWRSRDEFISDVLLWTPSHGRARAWRRARTYIQQLCADTGCSLEDLPEEMDDREGWRKMSGRSVLMARHDDDDEYDVELWKKGVSKVLEVSWRETYKLSLVLYISKGKDGHEVITPPQKKTTHVYYKFFKIIKTDGVVYSVDEEKVFVHL